MYPLSWPQIFSFSARDFKSSVFQLSYQVPGNVSFWEFLVWVINYYHVNGFHLFWDTMFQTSHQITSLLYSHLYSSCGGTKSDTYLSLQQSLQQWQTSLTIHLTFTNIRFWNISFDGNWQICLPPPSKKCDLKSLLMENSDVCNTFLSPVHHTKKNAWYNFWIKLVIIICVYLQQQQVHEMHPWLGPSSRLSSVQVFFHSLHHCLHCSRPHSCTPSLSKILH